MIKDKFFFNEITLLKVIAVCFITWFHFKWTVPPQYSNLFIGGAFGNSLFFYASGYLLKSQKDNFVGEWLLRKFIRIMPAVWITCLISILFGKDYNFIEYIYPTPFWFINAILFFFLIIYILKKWIPAYGSTENYSCFNINTSHRYIITMIFIAIMYLLNVHLFVKPSSIIMDASGVMCWGYYFIFFLLGMYDRYFKKKWVISKYCYFLAPFSICLFFVYKKIAVRYEILITLQSVIIPILLFYVMYSFKQLVGRMMKWKFSNSAQHLTRIQVNNATD